MKKQKWLTISVALALAVVMLWAAPTLAQGQAEARDRAGAAGRARGKDKARARGITPAPITRPTRPARVPGAITPRPAPDAGGLGAAAALSA